jgi:hypothetical protein
MATQVTLNSGSVDSAGSLALKTNGTTTAVTIDTSQNVGIGTISPAQKLNVSGSGSVYGVITNTGTGPSNLFLGAGNAQTQIISRDATTGAVPTVFLQGTTESMRIDSSGNVGVGTSSPSARLHVNSGATDEVARFEGTGSPFISIYDTNVRQAYLYASTAVDLVAESKALTLQATGANYISALTNGSERMRIDSSGNLLVGTTSGSSHIIQKTTSSAGDQVLLVQGSSGFARGLEVYNGQNGGAPNAANAVTKIGQMNVSGRSLNAAGTVNASGADYAEYMTKDGNFTVAKGDLVGINAEGKLTNVFADAVSFVVKSTDPSYVGGDTWGNEEALGLVQPKQPTQRQATEDAEAETDEEFEIRQAAYESDKATFDAALEAARQTVDRIAFAGQVPVNVLSATAGQYIVPVNNNGAIKGESVNEADMTLTQYMKAVGKVIAIESDGRARIIVKVA